MPQIKLGMLEQGGLAPAMLAIVERGAYHRPVLAATIDAEIELSTRGEYPPVRIMFENGIVLVEDRAADKPDLRISGSLPDLVSLMVAPLVGGIPSPAQARGRAALGLVAQRRLRVEGRLALMRRFLTLIRV